MLRLSLNGSNPLSIITQPVAGSISQHDCWGQGDSEGSVGRKRGTAEALERLREFLRKSALTRRRSVGASSASWFPLR